jgi:hypothetical protein
LFVLLVLSLAVHLGVLVYYARERYRVWRIGERYWREALVDRAALRKIDRLCDDFMKQRQPLSKEYRAATRELGALAEQPNPDSARVESVLDRIERNQAAMMNTSVALNLATMRLYKPESRRHLNEWRMRDIDTVLARWGSGRRTKSGGQ